MSAYRSGELDNCGTYGVKSKREQARSFLEDNSGSELVEWVLVTLVLLLATGLAVNNIRVELVRIFEGILRQLAR